MNECKENQTEIMENFAKRKTVSKRDRISLFSQLNYSVERGE